MNIDIVVPFYNEEACISSFVQNLLSNLDKIDNVHFAFFFVNDGSVDRTASILDDLAEQDDRICVIHLLGNHGHQKALVAGLDQCRGEAVLMMDGDGQHPAAMAAEMISAFIKDSNYDIIQGVRLGSQGGVWKDATSRLFYWLVNRLIPEVKMEPGVSDFRVMSAYVVDVVRSFPDRYRNLRILLAKLRLPTKKVHYQISTRIAGPSKYNWRRMVLLATDGIFAFSSLPLRLALILMGISAVLGIGYMFYAVFAFAFGKTVPGWSSLIGLTAFLFSGVFGVLAIIAEYIARIYEDVRRHPKYIKQVRRQDPAERNTSDLGSLNKG